MTLDDSITAVSRQEFEAHRRQVSGDIEGLTFKGGESEKE